MMQGFRRLSAYTLLLSVLSLSTGCSVSKELVSLGDQLTVSKMTVQRIVPGMEESTPYDELTISLTGQDATTVLDSVYYLQRVYPITSTGVQETIRLKSGTTHNDTMYVHDARSAQLFYHIGEQRYYVQFDEVERLQDVVMP